MSLQVIKDSLGNEGVFIPMSEWEALTEKNKDLKKLMSIGSVAKKRKTEIVKALSNELVDDMFRYFD